MTHTETDWIFFALCGALTKWLCRSHSLRLRHAKNAS